MNQELITIKSSCLINNQKNDENSIKYINFAKSNTNLTSTKMKNSEINQFKVQSERKCRLCKTQFTGRSHKIFCSATCKAQYHIKLNKVTMDAAERINTILL
jgi:hypothetical protein